MAVAIMVGICTRHRLKAGKNPDFTTTVFFLVHAVLAQSTRACSQRFMTEFPKPGAGTEDCGIFVALGNGVVLLIFVEGFQLRSA